MNTTLNSSDSEIKWSILNSLKFDPTIKFSDFGILVKGGVVTLIGSVASYGEKWNALCAVHKANDSKVIVDDIIVSIPMSKRRSDDEILKSAKEQIAWSTKIHPDTVHLDVKKGWVTVSGELEWWYLKNSVSNILNYLDGINGITNLLTIKRASGRSDFSFADNQAIQNDDQHENGQNSEPRSHSIVG